MRIRLKLPLCAALLIITGGCKPSSKPIKEGDLLRLDLGRRATVELIGYYGGGLIDPPSDPFARKLVVRDEDGFFLNLDTLAAANSWAADKLKKHLEGQSAIGWDGLSAFLEQNHARIRRQPSSLEELFNDVGYDRDSDRWLTVEVTGVMSTMRRHVSVQRSRLVEALRQYNERDGQVIYPLGTSFVAEHFESDSLGEVTVMRKREDGHWDFFAYGGDGVPVAETAARPRALRVPTQCVGCHFGSKLYEPEKSFPGNAPAGPHGPRKLHVDEAEVDPEVVRFFDEHRKRSDRVLGLHATIFVSRLRSQRSNGTIDPDMSAILDKLGL